MRHNRWLFYRRISNKDNFMKISLRAYQSSTKDINVASGRNWIIITNSRFHQVKQLITMRSIFIFFAVGLLSVSAFNIPLSVNQRESIIVFIFLPTNMQCMPFVNRVIRLETGFIEFFWLTSSSTDIFVSIPKLRIKFSHKNLPLSLILRWPNQSQAVLAIFCNSKWGIEQKPVSSFKKNRTLDKRIRYVAFTGR